MDRGHHFDFSRFRPKTAVLERVMPHVLIMRYPKFRRGLLPSSSGSKTALEYSDDEAVRSSETPKTNY
jgi:hypothetical protein